MRFSIRASCSSLARTEEDYKVKALKKSHLFKALKVVMVAELFVTGDREFQTAGAVMLTDLDWKLIHVNCCSNFSCAYWQSWDVFFRNARDGAPPGAAYISPPAIRPFGAVATVPATGAMTQAVPDIKMVDDHLAVQAIIRAYQVWLTSCSLGTCAMQDLRTYLSQN